MDTSYIKHFQYLQRLTNHGVKMVVMYMPHMNFKKLGEFIVWREKKYIWMCFDAIT